MLLDTCAVIWLAGGVSLSPSVVAAIADAALGENVHVSVASAWEIGTLARRAPEAAGPQFLPDPKTWFARFMNRPGLRPAAITADIAIDASQLPGPIHGDPGDRLIVATARHLGLPIVTRDRRIIAYAAAGFVRVLPC